MIILITFAEGKEHLRVDHNVDDADIQRKIDQATNIVLDYLKMRTVPSSWTGGTAFSPPGDGVPGTVKAATLLVLGELWENREASVAIVLSDAVKSLLHRWRDPAMA